MLASTVKATLAVLALFFTLLTTATPPPLHPPSTTPNKGPITADRSRLRNLILDQHNIHRQAHHVANLTWSDELAANSQQFTDLCVPGEGWASLSPGHGSNTMNSGSVSEDTYHQATIDAIAAWAGEAQYGGLTYDPVQCSGVCGHFTQMIWKDTQRVGCSWNDKTCDDLVVFQCYYDPPGNIENTMDENVLPQ